METKTVSKLVFYAQSTSAVILGRDKDRDIQTDSWLRRRKSGEKSLANSGGGEHRRTYASSVAPARWARHDALRHAATR